MATTSAWWQNIQKRKNKSTFLSFIITFLPKIGPLAGLRFKAPNDSSEKFYNESFNVILGHYSSFLNKLQSGNMLAENINFDTGEKTTPGEYDLADKTYYKLVGKLGNKNFETVNDALKENIVSFYTDPKAQNLYKPGSHKWKKISVAMRNLRSSQAGLNSDK